MSTIDGRYLAYCKTDTQVAAVSAVIEQGSLPEAADALGITPRVLQRTLARVRRQALATGDHLQPMDRQTNVIRDDEGRITRWDKTKSTGNVPLYLAMQEGIDVRLAKPAPVPKTPPDELCSVLSIADQHIGMLAYGVETGGDDWNTDIAVHMLASLIDQLFPKGHRVKHGVMLNLGDLIHFDGMLTKTPQSGHIVDADTRPGKLYRAATSIIRYAIDKMLKHCDTVHVMNIRGNHDESSLLWLNTLCQHVYADEPRVTVPNNDCHAMTHSWGGNFFYGYHGNGLKPQAAFNDMSAKFAREIADARYVWMLSGHLHNPQSFWINSKTKCEIITTLSPVDAWSSSHGYGSHRAIKRTDLRLRGGKDIELEKTPDDMPEQEAA